MSMITFGLLDGAGTGGFNLNGIASASGGKLTLSFSGGITPVLTGNALTPGNWLLTNGAAVTSVSVLGANVIIIATGLVNGSTYSLTIPTGLTSTGAQQFLGPDPFNFTYSIPNPTIASAYSVDARTLDVVFTSPANVASATNPSNYSITPTLTISAITMMTAVWYRLTTSKQTVDQAYVVTAPGVLGA